MKKKIILFVHSAGAQYAAGKGSYDLVKYLRSKLSDDFKVLFPKIRQPNTPTYEKYKEMYSAAFAKLTAPVILVGHSLGGSTLLKYLSEEKPDLSITGLFLVATPYWGANMKEFQLQKHFHKEIPASPVLLYHSKNDPFVPFDHLKKYSAAFKKAIVHELPGKEHIFSKGLPKLVSDLRKI